MDIRKIIICFTIVTLAVVGTACSRNISDQTERADATQGKDEEQVSESEDATLEEISSDDVYVWYSDIRPEKTVEVVNHLKARADALTYACVGTRDGIASWNTMKDRLDRLSKMGIPTEFHKYEGLSHGFGIGTGTVAEGWLDDAVKFWNSNK